MKQCDVSVIIPVYNTERYIKQCVDSVINQTVLPKELILVDDGSNDSSSNICDDYEKKYDFIKVIHKENAGLGMARNSGMQLATAEYIMFLDSDDYIETDMLETLYSYTNDMHTDLVKSGFFRVDLQGNIQEERRYNETIKCQKNDILEYLLPRTLGSLPDKHDSLEMGVTCSLLRRSIIDLNRITFPSERELISEDLVFNISFLYAINSATLIPYVGYMYRTTPGSLTVGFRENRFEASKRLYENVSKKIDELKIVEEAHLRWDKTFLIYLWMCVKQEKNMKHSINRIRNICSDPVTRNVISSFPTNKLEIKQRVFVNLLKHRAVFLLLVISKF